MRQFLSDILTRVLILGPRVETPPVPDADHVALFARKNSARMLPGYIGPSGLSSSLQPFLGGNKVGFITVVGNGTTIHNIGLSLTTAGTATAVNVARTSFATLLRRMEWAITTAATSAIASFRSGSGAQYFLGRAADQLGGFHFVIRFGRGRGAAANATLRAFTGMTSILSAPTDANPSTQITNAIGVGCDAADTNYQIIHRNGSAAATMVDTGIAKSASDNAEMYELALFAPPGQDDKVHYRFTRLNDGVFFEGEINSNLPIYTTALAPMGFYSVGGTSSVIGYIASTIYIETD